VNSSTETYPRGWARERWRGGGRGIRRRGHDSRSARLAYLGRSGPSNCRQNGLPCRSRRTG
jgi:hypothetical protein